MPFFAQSRPEEGIHIAKQNLQRELRAPQSLKDHRDLSLRFEILEIGFEIS
jgi:hypothetical protein